MLGACPTAFLRMPIGNALLDDSAICRPELKEVHMMSTSRATMLRIGLLVSIVFTTAGRAAPAFADEPRFHANTMRDMDLSVDPGVDFYRYANGGWLEEAVIPADFPAWDTMTMLDGQTRLQLVELLETAADDPSLQIESDTWKAVRLFQQGVDLETRNQQGVSPIRGSLDAIAAISNSDELHAFLETSVLQNVPGFFFVNPGPDVRGGSEVIAYLAGPTLGMGNRGYYLVDNASNQTVQRAYIETAARLLSHSGHVERDSDQAAEFVFAFEAELAEATWSLEESLDFDKILVESSLQDLERVYPAMDWERYFAALGLKVEHLTVTEERYLERLSGIVASTPLEVIKNYLALQLLWSSSSSLDEETEAIAFDFFGGALSGMGVQAPIEGRILDQVNVLFGDALGQMYVEEHFSPEARLEGEQLAQEVVDAFRVRLEQNAWMTPATRTAALAKLDLMQVKVGYPDTWDTYDDVTIGTSYFSSALSAFSMSYRESLAEVGEPIDRGEWPFPPQTVNAMYNPANNEIVVPAAVLQAPLFDATGDVATNLGAIGFVIGHEITHGFDVEGSQFNGEGVLSNWWTAEDAANFIELNNLVVEQYGELSVDGTKLDGERTLAENVADLGGIQVAYDALQTELVSGDHTARVESDFAPDQRFFISAASVWRSAIRAETLAAQLAADTHAPSVIRAVQPLRNCDAFYEAFDIAPGDPMYLSPESRVVIW
jgi:predicted metalloendopeptidase